MTPNQFKSAVMKLVVRTGPDGFVTARPIYHEAGGAFLRAPRHAFARIMKARNVDVGDAGPADFIGWLDAAPDDEIQLLIDLMRDFEHDARDAAVRSGSGPHMQDLWRLRHQVAEANDKTRETRSNGGRKKKENRASQDEALKSEILSKLKALRPKPRSRLDAALRIETALIGGDFERGKDRIYEILTDLGFKFRSGSA
jgi:hypothetical protein